MSSQGRVRLLAIITVVVVAIVAMAALAIVVRNWRYAKMPRVRLVLQAQPEATFVFSAPELGALMKVQGEEDTYCQIARGISPVAVGTEAVRQVTLGSNQVTVRTRVRDREDLARQGETMKGLLADLVPGCELGSSEMVPITEEDLESVRRIIQHRLRAYGVARPLVQVQRPDRVMLELRARNREKARDLAAGSAGLLAKTGLLEFRLIPREYASQDRGPEAQDFAHRQVFVFRDREGAEVPTPQVIAESRVVLTAEGIAADSADILALPQQPTAVVFRLNQQAAEEFEESTRKNIGRYLGMVLDGEMITCPVIREAIPGGNIQISGGFDAPEGLERARELRILLNAGALPFDLECIESHIVEPPD